MIAIPDFEENTKPMALSSVKETDGLWVSEIKTNSRQLFVREVMKSAF